MTGDQTWDRTEEDKSTKGVTLREGPGKINKCKQVSKFWVNKVFGMEKDL